MDTRALAKERFLWLLDDLAQELGSMRQACFAANVDPTYPKKLRDNPKRHVGLEQIANARAKLRLRPEFFDDPKLGPRPNYRDFVIGRSREKVERDDEQGYPEIEAFIAEMANAGTPVSTEAADRIRALKDATGHIEIEEMIALARARNVITARREFERPLDERAQIDSAQGQKPLSPTKRKR